MAKNALDRLLVSGFKSIRDLDLDLRQINALIGRSGAGKSNLICLFRLLNFMTTESLQLFVGRHGGADSLLHFGASTTPQMSLTLDFTTETGTSEYHARLMDASRNMLLFAEERISFHRIGKDHAKVISLGAGHTETRLLKGEEYRDKTTCNVIHHILRQCQVYNFLESPDTGRIRNPGYAQDNRYLRQDGGNLAAFLLKMRNYHPRNFELVADAIAEAYPEFDGFVLQRDQHHGGAIGVNWRDKGRNYIFHQQQAPDGFLRFVAMATLFLQPEEDLPDLIILDEPEISLHPQALSVLCRLINTASEHAQVLFSTQSVFMVDQLSAEDVLVVERDDGVSTYRRPDSEELENWLDRYSLSHYVET
jgi:predicted ATPase